jgi:hypothetical protein
VSVNHQPSKRSIIWLGVIIDHGPVLARAGGVGAGQEKF